MAPSNLLRSTAKSAGRITPTFPVQTRYATAINSRRSIWDFLGGNKPQDQTPKEEKQVEADQEQQKSSTETQRLDTETSTTTTTTTQSSPNIIEQVQEVEEEILSTPSPNKTAEEQAFWPADLPLPSLRQYPYTLNRGTVTSVGLMDKTVRVSYQTREWDRKVRKYYPKTVTYLVHDPRNSLRQGDVIEFSSGAPRAPRVRHVVERIISPFGVAVEDRPAVLTREEREAEMVNKRMEKLVRKAGKVAAEEGVDVEKATRRVVESKEHIGRIRALVIERAAAEAQTNA
ncbi:hypothetical protein TSTA_113580 [Talaromyces stipitatus ATCC 10500]|uniref:Nucleic acid-binding protein n=1 Tax=Talaromyces stipitatus (strain ATCC 10500 / CBS 375.48 / QM 6759 / NRRL 1006) TaxID=441959 RepID=B8MD07_TALSN|nr:uncharacterized protein TSTA_113580 [Talaromyces stipitatus ATCC 10500]EED17533.1 hypothetical protein TSTA_113580 [Talaromyces stipitatus ATCC 10500]